jgi:exosortase
MSVTASKHLWRVLAVSAAIAFAFATVLVKLGNDWWTDENYSHGLLIPIVIGYILWSQRERLSREPVRPSFVLGLLIVCAGLAGLWAGTAGAELFMQRISLVLVLVGTIVYFWGLQFVRLTAVSLGLLLLAIPIPAIVFNKIAFPLQLFASRCAVWSMSVLDIPVLRQGNVIELIPLGGREIKRLEVVEACSGIRSLMTLATLAVVFAYFTHPRDGDGLQGGKQSFGTWIRSYGFWRSLIIVLSAVPIAILTNAGRVSGTGVLAHYYGTEIADGFFHSFSGWVIYVVAFVMLFGVGWILERFKPKSQRAPGTTETIETSETRETTTVAAAGATKVIPAEGTE